MAEDKKTQMGTPGRTVRPTGSQTPVAAAVTPIPAATPLSKTSYLPPVIDPLIDTTIAGRYQVDKKLGEGGMGAVYLATHKILEKQVALKVLHGEFARKPDLVERFIQEAKSASRIRHENVIDISDFGSTPEGLVFFAMELLTGHDLHDEVMRARVAGRLLPWSRTKKIFLQICAALSAAHAKGIVHRDLKPENVYLIDFLGDPDFVKLLDFGIAKLTEVAGDEGGGGRKLTKTGMLFGTPEYMSPEQARGETVDHRVDVYAMGCILFQLVTGRVPFEADNFMGVLSMHLTEPPPQIAPETFDMIGAPRELAEVIERALAKDRNIRWQTIDDLANAVREVSGDPPVADRSQPNRAPSVPAPASPTLARPIAVTREVTGRVRTQWTGDLKIPEVATEEAKQPRSKLPLMIGLGVVLVGGGIAAFVATRGGSESAPPVAAPVVATGSATVQKPPPPPPPPEAPKLPDMARIELDSTPHGATVTDLTTNQSLKTPARYSVPGSLTPRQFKFHMHGFSDTTVELVPSHEKVTYVETLVKGPTGDGAVHKVDPIATKPVPELAGSAVVHPDSGSPDVKPPEPPKPEPPKDECPDDGTPCLKRKQDVPGLGSGT